MTPQTAARTRWRLWSRIHLLMPVKEMQEMQVWSLHLEDPLEEEIAIHSRILAWKSHGQRSLEGYHLWGLKDLGELKSWLKTTFKKLRSWHRFHHFMAIKSWLKTTFKKLRSWHRFHHFMANRRRNKRKISGRYYFLGFQNHFGQ